jgi:predicted permease
MNLFRSIWIRARSLAQQRAVKQEIDEELRFHLEQRIAENLAAGMSPDEAARSARKRFGNFQSVREECRERRGGNLSEALAQDVRFGLRMLRKNPGFSAVAVLTLAVGIGACTAMFSIVHAVLLRPLPFARPDRLVWIEDHGGMGSGLSARATTVRTVEEWRRQSHTFEQIAAYNPFFDYVRYTLTGAGEPERLRGVAVSQNFLDTLGVRPLLGRNFTDADCTLNTNLTDQGIACGTAVIFTHAFWRQRFGGDPGIVGKSLTLSGQSVTVVGVLPPYFDFDSVFSPGQEVEMLVPFPFTDVTQAYGNTVFAIGRLKDSATLEEARSEFGVIYRRIEQQYHRDVLNVRMVALGDQVRGRFRAGFSMLFGAVVFILLIACVNLSNLLLARANARRKEFAVRVALGADRWRLARQTLTESLVLSMLGCAAAVPLVFAAARALLGLQTFGIPLLKQASVNGTVLAFTAGVSVFAGLLCGVLPTLYLARQEPREALNDADARSGAGRSAGLVRRTLVVAEVALACLLLVGAGLLIRSFIGVLSVDLGFQPRQAVALRADTGRQFDSRAEADLYFDQLADRVAAVPGVESVGLTDTLPLGRNREPGVRAKGESYEPGHIPTAFARIVDHNYLQTMGIPLRQGRYFDRHDIGTSENVVIINETLARKLWPGRDAVGQMMEVPTHGWVAHRVVGVVADVRHSSLEEKPGGEFYLDIHQSVWWGGGAVELVVRTSRSIAAVVPAVRAAMKEFDPTLPTSEVTTLEQIVDRAVAPRRLITNLLGGFSALALTLAAIGLYGVISYSVGQRTREIGIRMAVGAQRHDVLRLVINEGLRTAMLGVAVGLVTALLLGRVLQSMLFGVTALDPVTFVITAITLMLVSLLACWFPARRATRVDPIVALRYE